MANLVGNALKFTPPGGRVRVCATREPGARVVEISDSGVGIPKEELPRLFDRFWRGQHEHAGVGLGLAIAKGVIDGHGGQLAVSSEPGAGTTVTIRLPEATAEPTLTLPEPALAAVMHR